MLNELQEVIRKNLPAEVGDNLRSVLATAEQNKQEITNLRKQLEEANNANAALMAEVTRIKDLERREKIAKEVEKALENKSWELRVKEALLEGLSKAQEQNLEVVKAVFANNRFKYNEFGSVPLVVPQGSYVTNQYSSNKSFEAQG